MQKTPARPLAWQESLVADDVATISANSTACLSAEARARCVPNGDAGSHSQSRFAQPSSSATPHQGARKRQSRRRPESASARLVRHAEGIAIPGNLRVPQLRGEAPSRLTVHEDVGEYWQSRSKESELIDLLSTSRNETSHQLDHLFVRPRLGVSARAFVTDADRPGSRPGHSREGRFTAAQRAPHQDR